MDGGVMMGRVVLYGRRLWLYRRMDELPLIADLNRIAEELREVPEFEKLTKMIGSATIAQSCHSDLVEASYAIAALSELLASPRRLGTTSRASTENALLVHAITLYARATATQGKQGERGAIDVRAKLGPIEQTEHDLVVRARNRAIAHVYPGEEIGERTWHRDHLLAQQFPDGWAPFGYTNRVQRDLATLQRLRRLIPSARVIVEAAFERRVGAIVNLMNATPIDDELFRRAKVDPIALYGSVEEALRAAKSRTEGIAHGYH
jgi:hypothetical protein